MSGSEVIEKLVHIGSVAEREHYAEEKKGGKKPPHQAHGPHSNPGATFDRYCRRPFHRAARRLGV